MPGTARAAIQIAPLDPRIPLAASRRARNVACSGCQRCKDRIEVLDRLLLAADHQAIAPLEPPDPAAGAAIEVAHALSLQLPGAADVILVERVAAIDHDVAGIEKLAELPHRLLRRPAGRHHHPHRPRLLEL